MVIRVTFPIRVRVNDFSEIEKLHSYYKLIMREIKCKAFSMDDGFGNYLLLFYIPSAEKVTNNFITTLEKCEDWTGVEIKCGFNCRFE